MLICLAAAGCSYAAPTGDTAEAEHQCINFSSASCSDNELTLDVATCDVVITSEEVSEDVEVSKLIVTIGNAYPGYEAYVDFTIKNVGDYDVQIKSVTINNPSPDAISVSITDLIDTTLAPNETVDGKVTVGVLDGAEQKTTYTFNITIEGKEA